MSVLKAKNLFRAINRQMARIGFFSFALACFCNSAHGTDCDRALEFTPHQYETPEIKSRTIVEEDRSEIEQIIDEAQPIFDQHVSHLIIEVNERAYWVERVVIADSTFFAVKIDSEKTKFPKRIRILESIWSGGISKQLFVTAKTLKGLAGKFPVKAARRATAIRMADAQSGRAFFAVFKDEIKDNEVTREIYDLTYARPYNISKPSRTKLQTRHRLSLEDLDHGFATWSGTLYPDVFIHIDPSGVARIRANGSAQNANTGFRWFFTRDQNEQLIRVVVYIDPTKKLPEIVTAYKPNAAALSILQDFIKTLDNSTSNEGAENNATSGAQ